MSKKNITPSKPIPPPMRYFKDTLFGQVETEQSKILRKEYLDKK